MIQLDWSIVKETVADAIELAPERRGEFLRSRCGSDTHLRDAVERRKIDYLLHPFAGILRWLNESTAPAKAEELFAQALAAISVFMR